MDQQITISLRMGDRCEDIRIPKRIEVRRLIRELDTIFSPGRVRHKYQLKVVNKGLLLDEGHHLSDYPITTGDLVEIEER